MQAKANKKHQHSIPLFKKVNNQGKQKKIAYQQSKGRTNS